MMADLVDLAVDAVLLMGAVALALFYLAAASCALALLLGAGEAAARFGMAAAGFGFTAVVTDIFQGRLAQHG